MTAVRWGIVGTGAIARLFASDLRFALGAQLVAVGSRDIARARVFADSFDVSRAYGSYRALIDDAEVDVVYIATPNSQHHGLAIAALEAGKAVLCEKPFTLNAHEAREVVQVARRTGRFCMEAMWMRFAPAVRELQGRIGRGEIGPVRHVRASLGFDVTFDPNHRIFDPTLGGGALLDLGVYAVSLCCALLGAPQQLTSHATLGETGVDEHVTMELSYANGVTASIETSVRMRLLNDAVVTGTQGQLSLSAPLYFPQAVSFSPKTERAAVDVTRPQKLLRTMAGLARSAAAKLQAPVKGSGYQYEAAEVMRSLAAGRSESELMSLDASVQVMETMDAARAAWTR